MMHPPRHMREKNSAGVDGGLSDPAAIFSLCRITFLPEVVIVKVPLALVFAKYQLKSLVIGHDIS